MEKLVINGPTRLQGDVTVSGAKNAAVAIIPATLLINGICTLENVPNISDVKNILEQLLECVKNYDHYDWKQELSEIKKAQDKPIEEELQLRHQQ